VRWSPQPHKIPLLRKMLEGRPSRYPDPCSRTAPARRQPVQPPSRQALLQQLARLVGRRVATIAMCFSSPSIGSRRRRRPTAIQLASTPCASSCRRRRRRRAHQRTQSDGSGDGSGDGRTRGDGGRPGTRTLKTEARMKHAQQEAHPRSGCR